MGQLAYITALSNSNYLPGVFALAKGLKKTGSEFNLVVMIPDDKAVELQPKLVNMGLDVRIVRRVCVPEELLSEKEYWNETFFKLRAAGLTEYDTIVLLDSDLLILKNIDHLFSFPHLSAVVDGAPFLKETHLNSGVMVIKPSKELEECFIQQIIPTISARKKKGLSAGDQDVIRDSLADWLDREELHLPPQYNTFLRDVDGLCTMLPNGFDDLYIIHFIGPYKPWNYPCRKWLSHFKRYVIPRKKMALRAFKEYRRILSEYNKELK